MNLFDFIEGYTFATLLGVFFAIFLVREIFKWLVETRRMHIAITMIVTIAILAVGVPLTSIATGGAHDRELTILVESVLFALSMWIYFGGDDEKDDPGVTRRRFFDRRVNSIDGLSARMSAQAATRKKERSRRSRVSRQPYFWNAFKKMFRQKDDNFFDW